VLEKYRKYVYIHDENEQSLTPEKTCEKIIKWALSHQVDHISSLSFPYNSTVCEKQDSLIDLSYIYDNGLVGKPRIHLSTDLLLKTETDGSSFPSGGLRKTHRARAYNVWDKAS
jgi:glutamine synthetase